MTTSNFKNVSFLTKMFVFLVYNLVAQICYDQMIDGSQDQI